MTIADIAHWIQRPEDALLDYHPGDEATEPCEAVLALPAPHDRAYDEGTP